MVRLTELSQEPGDSDFSTTDFDSDDDSVASFEEDALLGTGKNLADETLLDRLSALRDIISPKTRFAVGRRLGQLCTLGQYVAWGLGKTAWVLSTSALLVVLPLALELEKETMLMQMENDQKLREQGAQQLLQSPLTNGTGTGAANGGGNKPTGIVPPGF